MTKRDVNLNDLPKFHNVDNLFLMSNNRGAILANIYEAYGKTSDELIYVLEKYVRDFSELEEDMAKRYMLIHLKQRGYIIVS